MSTAYNAIEDDIVDLESLFSKVNSYFICHATGRIVVSLPEGLAIVDNNVIQKYYEGDSPFRGKTGVKLSCMLPYSQIIAVVPEEIANVTYVVPDTS